MTPTNQKTTYRLPQRFYDDHVARIDDDPDASGTILRHTKKHYWIEMDDAQHDELLSDARHYSSAGMYSDPEYLGLVSSARATIAAIEKEVLG